MKRGEVPGEGRSGSDGRDAITPPPPPLCNLGSARYGNPGVGGQNLRNALTGRGPEGTNSNFSGPARPLGARTSPETVVLVVVRRFPGIQYFSVLVHEFTLFLTCDLRLLISKEIQEVPENHGFTIRTNVSGARGRSQVDLRSTSDRPQIDV